ncbi:hypothetical protein AQUCO_00201135v1 [Aquilegia coerulea]|uniref:Cytochrome P450 n=1 Tax=Aquilegia coerulea TaxID=218851 RepID=A0A2G5F6H5_AQUCA|nr:hypothetical protein AQUCO_00201135v1 [Aquilegia coerulea]
MESFAYLTTFNWVGILLSLFLAFAWLWSKNNNSKSSPPGPLGLPIIGTLHLLGDLPPRAMRKLSQKYGPIMKLRIGRVPVVVVSTPEAAELFLKTNDKIISSKPTAQVSKYMSYGSKGIVSTEYGPYWRNIRKLCTVHLLSVSKIDSFRPTREEEVRHLIKDLREAAKSREVVDIGKKLGLAVEEMTYRMIFGDHRKHITESFKFKPCVQESLKLAGAFNFADFLPFIGIFDPQGMTRRWKIVSKLMDEFLEKIIDEYEQNPTEQEEHHGGFIDILLSLMKSNNTQENKLDKTEVKANALEILAAGIDTSAISVEWVFSELLRHPQVMEKVQEELTNVIGLDQLVEETDLAKLNYLNMVIKESMRIHPINGIMWRKSIEDMTINNFYIPKGTWICINIHAINRDPVAWPENPEEFHPERFVNTDIDFRGHDMQLLPFGSGRRKCAGMELGLRTVQLVLAQLVHCFNWELPDGLSPADVDMKEVYGLTITRATPLLVRPTYRLRVHNS